MKKLTVFVLISIMVAGSVFAQPIREQRGANPQTRVGPQAGSPQARGEGQREIPKVTVNGTLKLDRGLIAVESGETLLPVPMLNRYIGFISGLREGSNVSVEGFQIRNMLHPTKVTIDGQTYDFARLMQNTRFGFGNDNRNMGGNQRMNNHNMNNQRPNKENYGHNRNNAPNHRNSNNSGGCCRR